MDSIYKLIGWLQVNYWSTHPGKSHVVIFVFARRYMAEIFPIRRKTQYNQSINQSLFSV